jgi:PAS domain S-box-containing protein
MTVETSLPSFVLAVTAVLGSGSFFVQMVRRRGEPTARPLVGLASVLFVTSSAHLAQVHLTLAHEMLARTVSSEFADVFWVGVIFISYIPLLGLWTVFVFEYTGRGTWVTRLVRVAVAGLFVVQIGALVFGIGGFGQQLALAQAVLVGTLVVVLVLAVIGIFLVIDESTRLGPLLFREALVLSGGAGALVVGAWLFLSFTESPVFTGSVLSSSLLFVFAIRHYSMFESLPVASVLGRDRVIDEMAEAVLVVGQDGTIQDVNPAVVSLLDRDREELVGNTWDTLFPGDLCYQELGQTDQPVRLRLAERVLTVTASEIRDDTGRLLGNLVVCQDVTDRREREQRLALLNRFLVETVSDRMDDVTVHANTLAANQPDDHDKRARCGENIWTTTTTLITLLTYIREIERGLATDDEQRTDVPTVACQVAESVETDGGQPTVKQDSEPPSAAIEPPLLESTLELLVTEAFETRPGALRVTVSADHGTVSISVTDDSSQNVGSGRGLDDLSIQLARLTIESAGGSVTASDGTDGAATDVVGPENGGDPVVPGRDESRSQIRLTLPAIDDPESPEATTVTAEPATNRGEPTAAEGSETGGDQP